MRSRKDEEARDVAQLLSVVRNETQRFASQYKDLIKTRHPTFVESARNLLHYLSLRQQDLRPLQQRLAALGLSSLGRAESNVLCTLDRVLETLAYLANETSPTGDEDALSFQAAQSLLKLHTSQLLGQDPPDRNVRIMVTMPGDAATNYQLVHDLLLAGMDCMRINCAHDDEIAWSQMIKNLQIARQALGRPCRIQMDLGGPKLRTSALHGGPEVIRLKPRRDEFGHVTEPATFTLISDQACEPEDIPCAQVDGNWLGLLAPGDAISLTDARGAHRKWRVQRVCQDRVDIETNKTTYLVPGVLLTLKGGDQPPTPVISLLRHHGALRLFTGDILEISRGGNLGTRQTGIACTLDTVFDDVRPGESIVFDDGRIAGTVETILPDRVLARITRAAPGGSNLGIDKGINLPDSHLALPALTEKDLRDLAFAVEHADIVGLSFTNSADDVNALLQQIEAAGTGRPGIVLKIETRRGFENLPAILLAAMRMGKCGVMIARGDLAVECGFVRLAEVQEEILWLCEAAHVPVIWATQVLESLAKEGMPSRAEITDAAMADRAECVMLNKGQHITHAVTMLDDILTRMQAHQSKKRAMLRELHVAHRMDT